MLKAEREGLMIEMDEVWQSGVPFSLEIALVVNTVAYAILNPSKCLIHLCHYYSSCFSGRTAWDVERLADHVKNSVVHENGMESQADSSTPEYFEQADFGDITDPTTILDMHGRVIVWALPGVMHPNRLVSQALHGQCLLLIVTRLISIWQPWGFHLHSKGVCQRKMLLPNPGESLVSSPQIFFLTSLNMEWQILFPVGSCNGKRSEI
jgi:hypothetical protein